MTASPRVSLPKSRFSRHIAQLSHNLGGPRRSLTGHSVSTSISVLSSGGPFCRVPPEGTGPLMLSIRRQVRRNGLQRSRATPRSQTSPIWLQPRCRSSTPHSPRSVSASPSYGGLRRVRPIVGVHPSANRARDRGRISSRPREEIQVSHQNGRILRMMSTHRASQLSSTYQHAGQRLREDACALDRRIEQCESAA